MDTSHEPAPVTIGRAVEILQLEFPDVTPSLLRYLQREGLISPERKPGGHRLYSAEDIERIRTIRQWQASRIPLKEIRRRLQGIIPEQQLPNVVDAMTEELLAGDLDAALALLEELNRSGTPLITICEDVLAPVMLRLGDDQGNHLIPVDMQFELDERLVRFLALATVPPTDALHKPVVLAACPIWERHDMPLRMQAALLTERGASVHFVGSMVEKEFLIDAMKRVSPDVTLISMTILPREHQLDAWFKPVIAAMPPDMHLIVGGLSASGASHLAAGNLHIVDMESYSQSIARVLAFAK